MKNLKNNLKFIWQYARENKFTFNIVQMINIINILLNIVMPILSAKIIINLSINEYQKILFIALLLLIIETTTYFISKISKNLSTRIYQNTSQNLNEDLVKNLLTIQNKELDNHKNGLFIQRLTNDTSKMADLFDTFLDIFTKIIWHIGILLAILVINPIIFIYILLCMIITSIIENHRTNIYTKEDKKYRKYIDNITGLISEIVRGSKDIKMLNIEKAFITEYNKKLKKINNQKSIMQNTTNNYLLFNNVISGIYSFALILILILILEHNLISITFAIVIFNYYNHVKTFPYILGNLITFLKDFNLSSTRIKEIIDGKEFKKETFGTKHIDKIEGTFEFNNVNFAYDKNPVLKNTTFKVNAGETVAFVGKSGAGKSTIFNLICKMYEINSGSITIDGIDINELDKDSIRGNITIISQDPYIFNMSIKDNLKIVKKTMSEEEMVKACKEACLDEFIETLPDKYDTIIGEDGVNLSGGEKQRLAIARALVQNTKIILFDEATSALDNETQVKIKKAINNMQNDYTILMIAHRLSTIKNVGRILYLDKGKIIAEGTHKELLKKCPKYKKLYEEELLESEEN